MLNNGTEFTSLASQSFKNLALLPNNRKLDFKLALALVSRKPASIFGDGDYHLVLMSISNRGVLKAIDSGISTIFRLHFRFFIDSPINSYFEKRRTQRSNII